MILALSPRFERDSSAGSSEGLSLVVAMAEFRLKLCSREQQ